jgi:hypothetical protein
LTKFQAQSSWLTIKIIVTAPPFGSKEVEIMVFLSRFASAVVVSLCLPASTFLCAQQESPQSQAGRFDGNWTTTVACDASTHMPAYKWTFLSTIANGVLHGQHGEEGGPGYMVIDGPVNADGSAKLHAKGTVQPGKAGLITQMKGNKYDYYVEAKFSGDMTGTGKRDEGAGLLGRPCSFDFVKQNGAPAPAPAQ